MFVCSRPPKAMIKPIVLSFFMVGAACAATITFDNVIEITGNFVGGGCGVGGSLTACGVFNGVAGALVNGVWSPFSNMGSNPFFVSGSGYNQTTVWSTTAGASICVGMSCLDANDWIPAAVAPNGEVGGQCASGQACVDKTILPNAPPQSAIYGWAVGGWVGGNFFETGGGDAVQFGLDGSIILVLPCTSGFCSAQGADVLTNSIAYVDGLGDTSRVWTPDGTVVSVNGFFPRTLASGLVSTESGLQQVGGGTIAVIAPSGTTVTGIRLIQNNSSLLAVGSASLWTSEVTVSTTSEVPEPGACAMMFVGLSLTAWRHRRSKRNRRS